MEVFGLLSKLLASLMGNFFPKGHSGASLHTLSKLYDVPVGFIPPPSFDAVYCFICRRRRIAVARYRIICLVLLTCLSLYCDSIGDWLVRFFNKNMMMFRFFWNIIFHHTGHYPKVEVSCKSCKPFESIYLHWTGFIVGIYPHKQNHNFYYVKICMFFFLFYEMIR